jgi:hypothetical protein
MKYKFPVLYVPWQCPPVLLVEVMHTNGINFLWRWNSIHQSQSHVTTDGQSVSMSWCQVYSETCDQILFSVWKLLCCLCGGALSDERSGLSPVSHFHQCLVHCERFNIIYIVLISCFTYMQYILDLCQHRLSTADHAKIYVTTAI